MEDNKVSPQEYNDVRLKIGLLEKDIQTAGNLLAKVSESIEKIQEMNLNLIKMLTLHEQRHSQHEKAEDEMKEDIRDLHSRISTQSRQMSDRLDQFEQHVTTRLDDLKTDLFNYTKTGDSSPKLGNNELGNNGLIAKIDKLNEWRWMVIGAVALAAWIIGELDILNKFLK